MAASRPSRVHLRGLEPFGPLLGLALRFLVSLLCRRSFLALLVLLEEGHGRELDASSPDPSSLPAAASNAVAARTDPAARAARASSSHPIDAC